MTGPTVSLAEAARRSPRSVATLRRWLANGTIAGATRDDAGAWAIPVAALVEAGAWPSTTPPDLEEVAEAGHQAAAEVDEHRAQVEALTARAVAAEAQADLERLLREAAERNADDLRTALRMLEAGPARPADPATDADQADLEAAGPWWRRVAARERRLAENRADRPTL